MSITRTKEQITNLCASLGEINESLSEISLNLLHHAIDGEVEAIAIEKRVQKAKQSVAKAMQILDGPANYIDNE